MNLASFFRFLGKNKLYTAINLFGLAVSLSFVILIADYAIRQLSTDKGNLNADRIYLLGSDNGLSSDYPMARRIATEYPEIEKICCLVSNESKVMEESQVDAGNPVAFSIPYMAVDSTFLDIFSVPFVAGDAATALDLKENVVITEALAEKLFGHESPLGKRICFSNGESDYQAQSFMDPVQPVFLTVTGVIKSLDKTVLPNKTEAIVRIENTASLYGINYDKEGWMISRGGTCLKTFILAHQNAQLQDKVPQMLALFKEHLFQYENEERKDVVLIPLRDVMLSPLNSGSEGLEKGNRNLASIMITIAIAILVFAVFNYINLTVAQTGFRAKEMASRKLLGASQTQVSFRLMGESVLLTLVAFGIGFFLAVLAQPVAMELLNGKVALLDDLSVGRILVYVVAVVLLGSLSGIIPTTMMSRFKPIDVVKGSFQFKSKMIFSRVFIVFQNIITVTMVASALVIFMQLNHLRNAPLGFNTHDIISVLPRFKSVEQALTTRNELLQLACVEEVALSSGNPLSMMALRTVEKEGKEHWVSLFTGDDAFFSVLGFQLAYDNHPAGKAVYLNETCFQLLGLTQENSEFTVWEDYGSYTLGGVFEDFKIYNLMHASSGGDIVPTIMTNVGTYTAEDPIPANILVKVTGNTKDAYKKVMETIEGVLDESPHGTYLDEAIERKYLEEKNLSTLVILFTFIAIVISSLGLLAMSTYFIQQRRKEVGVRKIMGSTRQEVLSLLVWHFLKLIVYASVLAVPLAYFIMHNWIQTYPDRIALSPLYFVIAVGFAIIMASLTILWQSIRVANTNPVELYAPGS